MYLVAHNVHGPCFTSPLNSLKIFVAQICVGFECWTFKLPSDHAKHSASHKNYLSTSSLIRPSNPTRAPIY